MTEELVGENEVVNARAFSETGRRRIDDREFDRRLPARAHNERAVWRFLEQRLRFFRRKTFGLPASRIEARDPGCLDAFHGNI